MNAMVAPVLVFAGLVWSKRYGLRSRTGIFLSFKMVAVLVYQTC